VAELDSDLLVDEFYMPLYRFAFSLSRRESDACDLVQQTYYIWALKGDQLRDLSKVKTWLFTTLYREFLKKARHDDRLVEVNDDSKFVDPPHVSPSAVDVLDAATVYGALNQLDDRYRGPVTLFYMQQCSYREIGEILGIPIGTVMSRIARGKGELRKTLLTSVEQDSRKVVQLQRKRVHG
jgi:RNA polymerase sigma-70 factor, ECF subfamily